MSSTIGTTVTPYISSKRFADALGVPYATVRGWIRRGVVPSIRVGGRRLVPSHALHAILQREPEVPPPR